MEDADFRIVFHGGEANQHAMDMRMLALSMLGAEKIVSDGLIIFVHRRLPKRGERAPVIAKAREPQAGSVELITFFQSIFGTLNLGIPAAKELVSAFLQDWWRAVIASFSGKPDVAELAINALLEQNQAHLDARDASETRQFLERMEFLAVLRAAIEGQRSAAEQFATPVGPSVERATAHFSRGRSIEINTEDADAIRDSVKLTWGPLEPLTLRTDGFRFHTNGLSVENPQRKGYLMAQVQDPRFDEPVNPYTEAAQRRAAIKVVGRLGYKGETLTAILIVDFIETVPE